MAPVILPSEDHQFWYWHQKPFPSAPEVFLGMGRGRPGTWKTGKHLSDRDGKKINQPGVSQRYLERSFWSAETAKQSSSLYIKGMQKFALGQSRSWVVKKTEVGENPLLPVLPVSPGTVTRLVSHPAEGGCCHTRATADRSTDCCLHCENIPLISHQACPRNQHCLGILHSLAHQLCTLNITGWGVVTLTVKCVSVTYGTFNFLSKYVLLQPVQNRELRNTDIKSYQRVSNNWELPSCQTFIPFTDLLDSILQLVTLEEDDKYRLVHIIPLEQRKEL